MNQKINQYRNKIDKVDKTILEKLAERMAVVRLIGEIKIASDLAVSDQKREEEIGNLRQQWAEELGLNKKLVKKIFDLIINEAKKIQL